MFIISWKRYSIVREHNVKSLLSIKIVSTLIDNTILFSFFTLDPEVLKKLNSDPNGNVSTAVDANVSITNVSITFPIYFKYL